MNDGGDALRARVLAALATAGRPLKARELARTLRLDPKEYRSFRRLLQGMEKSASIARVKGHRYVAASSADQVTGTLSLTRRGDAFLRQEGSGDDVFISGGRLGTAMDGDRVVAVIERRPRGRNPEGQVVEVLRRARETVVGTFHRGKRLSFVVPLGEKLEQEIMVPPSEAMDASEGDVVVVRLRSFGDRRSKASGVVEKVLGPLSDPGVDVLAIAHAFSLPLEFPSSVLEAAEDAAARGMANPGADRVDRTELLCFTIDPSDAKDHDDALSLQRRSDGLVEVGVHIADVSHFVLPSGPVDREALSRGTSVYLVDRVIPMLPAVLSSDVCSLMVDQDRFAISAFMVLDREGRVHERRYERTTIRCRHALSYEDAQAILDGGVPTDPELGDALRGLDDHARGIRKERRARGALDLDLPEAKVILDGDGLPVDIQRRERAESHRLIEDYMILANEVVANDLEARELDALYRVHESPSAEKVVELAEALKPLGISVPTRKRPKPSDMQALLEAPREPEARMLVSTLVLRTLKKARYDTENLGHFGLASGGYTHFTSPIRRYPDLIVHRVLAGAFMGGAVMSEAEAEALEAVAEQSSLREQSAEGAERATIALKKVEFMERHLGESFFGRISGVAPFGVFVTLEDFFVEGLVHVRTLDDDFYDFNQGRYALVGARSGRSYRLGERLEVQVTRVDKEARQIDFLAIRKLAARLTPSSAPR
ncbi:MAG: ribonuclease R [Gemmatimonadota bacterium]|nr:ribonuclease R [Gemmatimonadota bacterium]MDH3423527.1 ribonuclease R [Gemmatimonadota bacterium]